ncbi:Protein kinase-like domain [Pseudocohnilembus persalinus]|uniref:Protein kinase-like domain n=1 Tax=Pseudocohnilembus persalinus TaxID=266149 RepID=A0A0V0QK59_PSEPJ|nr:Protein kinase-like domain [Pseudocohnilembus persalinus]|eukprot:KRX02681.1 Protein kinase-like domain [Pseudocohnilembus persalinus]
MSSFPNQIDQNVQNQAQQIIGLKKFNSSNNGQVDQIVQQRRNSQQQIPKMFTIRSPKIKNFKVPVQGGNVNKFTFKSLNQEKDEQKQGVKYQSSNNVFSQNKANKKQISETHTQVNSESSNQSEKEYQDNQNQKNADDLQFQKQKENYQIKKDQDNQQKLSENSQNEIEKKPKNNEEIRISISQSTSKRQSLVLQTSPLTKNIQLYIEADNYIDNIDQNSQQEQKTEQINQSDNVDWEEFKENWNIVYGQSIKWKQGNQIGAGGFGEVYKALNVEKLSLMAVKRVFLPDAEEDLETIKNEISVMEICQHPNIVQCYGSDIIKQQKQMFIYMEYMNKGSLQDIIQNRNQEPLPESTIKEYCQQILQGLVYIHSKNIIHKDIKSGNILISENGTIKLGDFGSSKIIEGSLKTILQTNGFAIKGSIPWMAPEIVKNSGYEISADIWSFGCTVIEMLTCKYPWAECGFEDPIGCYLKIGSSEHLPYIPDNISQKLKDFIYCCVQKDKSKRSTAEDLLKHPFLQD